MAIHTPDLQTLIHNAAFLSAAQRSALLSHAENLSPERQQKLIALLTPQEPPVADRIARAAKNGDDAFFKALDALIATETHAIRKAEENAERSDEASNADHLFDDSPSPHASV